MSFCVLQIQSHTSLEPGGTGECQCMNMSVALYFTVRPLTCTYSVLILPSTFLGNYMG